MLLTDSVIDSNREKDRSTHKWSVNVKRLASKLAFSPGQTEPVTWCLADHNHPELPYKSEEKSGGVVTVGTETLNLSELCRR